MITIHKYQLGIEEMPSVEMPRGASVIRVDVQEGKLWIWAVVDTDEPTVRREFICRKTGAEFPILECGYSWRYLGFGAIFIKMELGLYVFEKVHVGENGGEIVVR